MMDWDGISISSNNFAHKPAERNKNDAFVGFAARVTDSFVSIFDMRKPMQRDAKGVMGIVIFIILYAYYKDL